MILKNRRPKRLNEMRASQRVRPDQIDFSEIKQKSRIMSQAGLLLKGIDVQKVIKLYDLKKS